MTAYLPPIFFALFVWWFSTGVILYLDGLPVRTFKWSRLAATRDWNERPWQVTTGKPAHSASLAVVWAL